MQPVVALVAAAGSGSRLGGPVPKALLELAGVPLVRRSVEQLAAGGAQRAVIVVAAGLEPDFERALAGAPIECQLVTGGAERQESVRRGLAACAGPGEDAVVLVHDAARPLVPAEVVAAVVSAVRAGLRAVVPVLPVIDSIRRVTGDDSVVVDRAELVGVQTPQGFDLATLRSAHEQVAARGLAVTDDAACCEAIGVPVHLVPGSRLSMKVTEPVDVRIAEALLSAPALPE
ncbi:2-C-methyl-D-erythritol 4-phosphate cytidylyltransferase [Naumannella sp. ID2617S]|uniref:2-C-methyl-D-erythritol 4-phosphate cytidylyltransferase n=1 Tax=Enemella dayhoffiae TaxID=2016507 RepID=A0A255H9G8_9ACTN|nr:2-C-methyl-D-erythritol 4-phosphate cytidylyltransferase [Enemella dayhoffiae]NNG21250.1 2-C-methyl-D-erythritol 4-phosphate cytidylyltransferase [Naumannella sp. ID2617S]OYO24438.1 2-C-methyl-D-erythritol 4-phosphate cytidylyltransferase [Enemella dayhoffiae]